MPENPLHLLLHPKSVAVAGASNNPVDAIERLMNERKNNQ